MKNLVKKIFVIFSLISIISISLTALIAPQASAVETNARTDSACNFLGFTSWDCGIEPNIDSEEKLKTSIWQIAANVATDITVAAAYLVIGYVIYGGYQYTFSGGDPSKVATGKKTLTQAFIGLAIVMSAYAIVSTIRFAILGGNGKLNNCMNIPDSPDGSITGSNCTTGATVVTGAIHWFIAVAGIVSAIFVVYGGISYVTSSGDPSKLEKAKKTITYALIGLAIVALAEVITAFVSNMIREANAFLPNTHQEIVATKTANINNNFIKTTTLKEDYENQTP